MTTQATTPTTTARRYRNAKAAQSGACNVLAIANGLVEAIKECRAEGKNERSDSACRLIAHQIAYLMELGELDDGRAYTRIVDEVEAIIGE